jgi:outer membrane protein assembly factor BamB
MVALTPFLAWGAADPVNLIWRTSLAATGNPPEGRVAATKQNVFVVSSGVRAYSVISGDLLWRVPPGTYLPRSLIVGKNITYVPEYTVAALDGESGRKIWEFKPDANSSLGRATTHGHALYFGTSNHHLYALRSTNGDKLWDVDLGPLWEHAAVVRGVTFSGGTLYVTVEQWRTPSGTNASGWLIALDSQTGKVLWRFSTGTGEQRRGLSSSPTVTSDLVLASDYLSNAIIAVDRRTGHEVWHFHGEAGFVGFPEAPIVIGEIAYAGSGDTNIYAISLNTGHMLWRTKLPGANEDYAVCGKSLLVNYGGLAALDRHSGRVIQTVLTGEDEFVTSDIAVVGNRAYIAGPKALYAFSCR